MKAGSSYVFIHKSTQSECNIKYISNTFQLVVAHETSASGGDRLRSSAFSCPVPPYIAPVWRQSRSPSYNRHLCRTKQYLLGPRIKIIVYINTHLAYITSNTWLASSHRNNIISKQLYNSSNNTTRYYKTHSNIGQRNIFH